MTEPTSEPDFNEDHGPDDEGYVPDEAFDSDAPPPNDDIEP